MTGVLLTVVFAGMLMLEMLLNEKENIVKLIVWAVMKLAMLYVIISGFMFWLDKFGIQRVLGIIAVFEVLGILWMYRQGKRPSFICEYKSLWIPIVVCVVALPFTWQKFGYFGMGQDQGVYQTEAISMIYGDGALQHNFDEYESLSSEEQEYFEDAFNSYLLGLYPYDETTAEITGVEPVGNFSYVYHGTHTFSALLALWGSIFGIENMQGIQTIFYLCAIFLLFYLCENLCLKKETTAVCIFLFSFSPIMLWVSKAALSEMFLVDLFLFYMYMMTKSENKGSVYWSAMPVATFAFYHISIYTVIPIFVLIYLIWAFMNKNSDYLKVTILVILATVVGLLMDIYTATHYSIDLNFKPLYHLLSVVNENNIKIFVIASGISASIIVFGMIYRFEKVIQKNICIPDKWKSLSVRAIMIAFFIVQIRIAVQPVNEMGIKEGLEHVTIIGLALLSGIFFFWIVSFITIKKPDYIFVNKNTMYLFLLFLYCVCIYTSVFKKVTPYYYYYGRYLAPFIAIVILLGGICVNKWKKIYLLMMGGIALLLYLPFDIHIALNNDDSKIQWSILEEIADVIESDDAVIIDDSVMFYCYMPIRSMTGAQVYRKGDNLEAQTQSLSHDRRKVYYISDNSPLDDLNKIVYMNYKQYDEYKVAPQETALIFPLGSEKIQTPIVCTWLDAQQKEYDISLDTSCFKGIGGIEGDFVWTDSEEVEMQAFIKKGDYHLTIKLGPEIPFSTILRSSYDIQVLVNGEDIGIIKLDEATKDEAGIDIPESVVKNGKNIIVFKSELWKISDYIENGDTRNMGFALKGVVFE